MLLCSFSLSFFWCVSLYCLFSSRKKEFQAYPLSKIKARKKCKVKSTKKGKFVLALARNARICVRRAESSRKGWENEEEEIPNDHRRRFFRRHCLHSFVKAKVSVMFSRVSLLRLIKAGKYLLISRHIGKLH